jgi:hypothetical protein
MPVVLAEIHPEPSDHELVADVAVEEFVLREAFFLGVSRGVPVEDVAAAQPPRAVRAGEVSLEAGVVAPFLRSLAVEAGDEVSPDELMPPGPEGHP